MSASHDAGLVQGQRKAIEFRGDFFCRRLIGRGRFAKRRILCDARTCLIPLLICGRQGVNCAVDEVLV
jgi:hypothetical protein